MPSGRVWGSSSAVAIDRDGKSIWFAERCGRDGNGCALPENKDVDPILKFDASGRLVKSFGAGMFHYPHGIFVDRNGNIWVADGIANPTPGTPPPAERDPRFVGNTVRQFSPDGVLLMTIGTQGVVGKGPYVFSGVSAVVVAPNGDVYVADGHAPDGNNRIVKYDRQGRYLLEWGKSGAGPTEFNPPHGLAIDQEGRIYVADRINKAVKVFDPDGKLLHVWEQFGLPNGVFVDKSDLLYVADNNWTENTGFEVSGIRIAHVSDGKLIANIPWGEDNTLEGVAANDAGNVYGAFTNKPGSHRFMKE
jgi:sugar lactone lactonase YvrE